MKKIFLSIILCFAMMLPTFAVTSVSTAQLNKQGWNYIKQGNYPSAFDSFTDIYTQAKTQQDYGYIIYGYLELIKIKQLPADFRVNLCKILQSDDFDENITDYKLRNILFAMSYKMINILANTDSKDKVFTNTLKADKQKVLNEYKNIYLTSVRNSNTPAENALTRLYYALYEYSTGDKKYALGCINNEMENIIKYCSKSEVEDSTEIVNYVLELCD